MRKLKIIEKSTQHQYEVMALRKEGFWDDHYQLELRNYEEDGDEGEVWFGRGLSRRISNWLIERINERHHNLESKIIDIGCGNAFLLITLAKNYKSEEHNTGLKLLGIDYSAKSIELSRKIIASYNYESLIELKQCDFLNQGEVKYIANGTRFEFVIDIGTFDAICLLAGDEQAEKTLEQTKVSYMKSLYSLVRAKSVLVLASCNHTEEELLPMFGIDCENRLSSQLLGRIETPRIKFGGKEGSQVTCLMIEFNSD